MFGFDLVNVSFFHLLWLELSMIFRVIVIDYNQRTSYIQLWCLETRRYRAPASVTDVYHRIIYIQTAQAILGNGNPLALGSFFQ